MEGDPHPITKRTSERHRKLRAARKQLADTIIAATENYICALDTYEIGRIQNGKTKDNRSDKTE